MSGSAQTPASAALQRWTVKQVVSGDCIVLREQPRGGPPPEKQVFLAHIKAGRVGKAVGDKVENDEPFGWAAREYLRKKLVGKEVQVQVDFRTQQNREYCWIFLNVPNSNEPENVVESLIREGLVEIRPAAGGRANDAAFQKLTQLEEAAKAAGKGRWSNLPKAAEGEESAPAAPVQANAVNPQSVRSNVKWTMTPEELRRFVESNKGKELQAVVEYVRDATTLRVCVLNSFTYFWVQLTGIRAPGFKQVEDATGTATGPKQVQAEPFADEARFFVELRLLQRDVTLTLDGVSNQYAMATVQHPRGLVAELLVQEGLARCVDWSLPLLNARLIERFRAAERGAKEKRSRLWKDYVPSKQTAQALGANEKEFTARVIEIGTTPDWLLVRKADGETKKVWLSSVRAPRGNDFDTTATQKPGSAATRKPLYDVPYVFEARELLRKRLLGQEVTIQVDYVQSGEVQQQAGQAAQGQAQAQARPERVCCTVTHGGANLAELLVSRGLLYVLRYRANDENRSRAYDALLAAESKAQTKGAGVHDNRTEPPVLRITELAGDANRSKQFLSFLKRAGRAAGIVEFVASGSRVRVYVPKESVLITLLLDGIDCPRASFAPPGGQSEQRGEEFGDAAREFTRTCTFQRDVSIEVNTMDRVGNFVGTLYVAPELVRAVNPQSTVASGSAPINLSVAIVEAGLARVHSYSAERTAFNKELLDAQDVARQGRLGLWSKTVETEITKPDTSTTDIGADDADDAAALTQTNGDTTAEASDLPSSSNRGERPAESARRAPGRKTNFREVVLTETDSGVHFFVQYVADGPRMLEWTAALRRELGENAPVAGAYRPTKGDACIARYSADSEWYRARVEKVNSDGSAQVRYVDYGNFEVLPAAELARLPSAYSLTTIPPASHECALAYVTVPTDDDDRRALRDALLDAVQRTLVVNVEYSNAGVSFVTLAPRENVTESINKQLIADGFAVVDTTARRDAAARLVLRELLEAQENAKTSRLNLWRYGDFTGTVV